ncbi:TonB family protein [Segatella paludivivens]|uniref:TonB family protein n=2 Tax=Segatella paludivivens TaxID=185294 RepID=UPI0003A1DAA3|nr:TonB family protein [Segatella paludivivens]
MAIYLLKVNFALILLYGFYRLMTSRDTFFALRRATLWTIYLISLTIPLLNIEYWIKDSDTTVSMANSYATSILPTMMTYANAPSITWKDFLLYVYIAVVTIMLLNFILQLGTIVYMACKHKKISINGTILHTLRSKDGPFSFFKWIFLNKEGLSDEELNEIIIHERTHVNQWHSLDSIFSEMFCIFCWFNPFAWLMKRDVRINLEFLADESVLAEGNARKAYQYHLLGLAYHSPKTDIANNFNVLPLKKRIKMMNKRRTKEIAKTKYLLFAPLAAALLFVSNIDTVARSLSEKIPEIAKISNATKGLLESGVTGNKVQSVADLVNNAVENQAQDAKIINIKGTVVDESGKPIQGALVIINGIKKGSVSDTKGNFSLNEVSDDNTIVVQYVGFDDMTFRAGDAANGIKITLKKDNSDSNGEDKVYESVDKLPSFPGGSDKLSDYFAKNIKNPENSTKGGFTIVAFTVNKDGSISGAHVVRSFDPELDSEALKVINSMPNWEPGIKKGKVVKTLFTIPVPVGNIKLQSSEERKKNYKYIIDGKELPEGQDINDILKPSEIKSIIVMKSEDGKAKVYVKTFK